MRLAFAVLALLLCASPTAHAVGRLVDVQIVDRTTGEVLTPILHRGEWWIAGRPGARYGVSLVGRAGERTLNVVSVDGVNTISGDTAAWHQTGYVLGPFESTRIDGWRKTMNQVAAFEFTALPDSYAARTDRPAHVGVIGVATFTERPRPLPKARVDATPPATAEAPAPAPAPAMRPESAADAAGTALVQRDRLGTGHGAIEESAIRYVDFRRAQATPNEIVTIRYDRLENLVAMGIVRTPIATGPSIDPFPDSRRFVADPPPRR